MAKALGTTPEEEHRRGIHELAQVRYNYQEKIIDLHYLANKRPGGHIIHEHGTGRGHRLVCGFQATRFRTSGECGEPNDNPTGWTCDATPLGSARAISPQRGAAAAEIGVDNVNGQRGSNPAGFTQNMREGQAFDSGAGAIVEIDWA